MKRNKAARSKQEQQNRMASPQPLHAVVVGGTGAIGREVLGQLLASARWGSVTAVGRRAAEAPAEYRSQSGYDAGKLKQVVVDMDRMEEDAGVAFAGADSVFCCLGTTRGAAGTADAFRKVDLHYVEAAARAAAAGGVPHFSLVSAQGAKAGVWASDWKPFHGLLYMQTKGKAEEAVKGVGFRYTTILRPGLLDRGELARGNEKLVLKLMSNVSVAKVAQVMLTDAERFHDARRSGAGGSGEQAQPAVKVLEMAAIQKFE